MAVISFLLSVIIFWSLPAFSQRSNPLIEWDVRLQRDISHEHGIFQNTDRAAKASDQIRDFMSVEFFALTLLAGHKLGFKNKEAWQWMLTNVALREANFALTDLGKTLSRRARPNGNGHNSFPSAHASSAFVMAAVMSYDLDQFFPDNKYASTLKFANLALATGVSWFRVEGSFHYPADVLVGGLIGYSIGHFGKRWIHSKLNLQFQLQPEYQGASVSWTF